jgi:hypothetical protein
MFQRHERRNARLDFIDHTTKLIDRQALLTQDQARIAGMADLKADLIDKASGLKKEEVGDRVDVMRRENAAAAQARAHAKADEKEQWSRTLEMVKLGQHQQEIDQSGEKVRKEGKGDLESRVQGYGKARQDKDIMSRESAVGRLREAAAASGGNGIPGVGKVANLRHDVTTQNPVIKAALGVNALGPINSALSLKPDERVNRNDWNQIKLSYVHEITGAGGPPEEKKMIMDAFEGDLTPAEQLAAVDKSDAYLKKYEETNQGTYGPDAAAEFKRRAKPAPPPGFVPRK